MASCYVIIYLFCSCTTLQVKYMNSVWWYCLPPSGRIVFCSADSSRESRWWYNSRTYTRYLEKLKMAGVWRSAAFRCHFLKCTLSHIWFTYFFFAWLCCKLPAAVQCSQDHFFLYKNNTLLQKGFGSSVASAIKCILWGIITNLIPRINFPFRYR